MCVCVCIYIYIHTYFLEREREREMVDFGKSDKMIKISGKMNKPNTYSRFSRNISKFIH